MAAVSQLFRTMLRFFTINHKDVSTQVASTLHTYGLIALPDSGTSTDLDSDSKPNGYIVPYSPSPAV